MLWLQTIPKLQWLNPTIIHFMLLLHASYGFLRDSAAYSHLGAQVDWDSAILEKQYLEHSASSIAVVQNMKDWRPVHGVFAD